MRSVTDLTAAALIRESAMRLFAELGTAGVSIRDVAADAGVSASLVMHHYGSKDRLKAAVDERATAALTELIAGFNDAGLDEVSAMSFASAFAERFGDDSTIVPYLRRLLIDGGSPAQTLFRTLFDATLAMMNGLEAAGVVKPAADAGVRAAFLLVNDLAVMVLREQIAGAIGFDPFGPEGLLRWGETVVEVYTNGVFNLDENGAAS
ncbi:MAG: TetR/AcrR family transcriptional regulator [Acidothermaceae bacterium]